jgi:hypothetical protein
MGNSLDGFNQTSDPATSPPPKKRARTEQQGASTFRMTTTQNERTRSSLWQLYTLYDTDDSGAIEIGEFNDLVADLICVHQCGEIPSDEKAQDAASRIWRAINPQATTLSWSDFLTNAWLVLEQDKPSPFDCLGYSGLGYMLLTHTSQVLQERKARRQRHRDANAAKSGSGAGTGVGAPADKHAYTYSWAPLATSVVPQGLEVKIDVVTGAMVGKIPDNLQTELYILAEGTGFSPFENRRVLMWAHKQDTLQQLCDKMVSGNNWPGLRGRSFHKPTVDLLSLWYKGRKLDTALTVEKAGLFVKLRSKRGITVHIDHGAIPLVHPPPAAAATFEPPTVRFTVYGASHGAMTCAL